MRVIVSMIGLWWLFAIESATAKPVRIDVLEVCDPKTACIQAELEIVDIEKKKVGSLNDVCQGAVVPVRGRLNGGRVRLFHVGFVGDCMPCATSFAAYLGQSAADNPVVRTSAGRFEIIDRDIRVGADDDLIVINEVTGVVVARYWGNFAAASFYLEEGRVYLAHGDGPCFVAPKHAPRAFTFAPGHCRDRRREEQPDTVDLAQANPKMQATVRSLIPPAMLVLMLRVPGTRLLALQLSDNCYQ